MKGNALKIPGIIQEALSASHAEMSGLTYETTSASRARALISVAKAIAQTGDISKTNRRKFVIRATMGTL